MNRYPADEAPAPTKSRESSYPPIVLAMGVLVPDSEPQFLESL
jgi:hypothetical protein